MQLYERIQEPMRFGEVEVEWHIRKDEYGRLLIGLDTGGKLYLLSYYKTNRLNAPIQFHSFDKHQRKNAVDFIRQSLGVNDYKPSTTRLKDGRAELSNLIKTRNQFATENLPM